MINLPSKMTVYADILQNVTAVYGGKYFRNILDKYQSWPAFYNLTYKKQMVEKVFAPLARLVLLIVRVNC